MDFFLLPQRGTRRRVADGTPSRSFWYVAVFLNDFNFSGKPLLFLTRWGIFYGRWCCWRSVASPTMVPSWPPSWILSRIKNHVKIVRNSSFGGLCMENNTWISKLHNFSPKIYFYFWKKLKKICIFTQKWLDHLLFMTSYLVTIATDHQ